MYALNLSFAGITYLLKLPCDALVARAIADYGAFQCASSVTPDYVVTVVLSQAASLPLDAKSEIVFTIADSTRHSWERRVRTYLSTHVAIQLYAKYLYVRLHAGLVQFGGCNILVSGPSGAGKTSLCLALAAAATSQYFAHEMLFVNRDREFIGWPQPMTVNAGTLAWLNGATLDKTNVLWTELSEHVDKKHRIGIRRPSAITGGKSIDLIVFPKRSLVPNSDFLKPVSRVTAFTKLIREVEYPTKESFAVLPKPEEYAGRVVEIASTLSQVPAYELTWHDDQTVAVALLEGLINTHGFA